MATQYYINGPTATTQLALSQLLLLLMAWASAVSARDVVVVAGVEDIAITTPAAAAMAPLFLSFDAKNGKLQCF
jgi:orotate phosphoribosyltransferase